MTDGAPARIRCKTCDVGHLERKQIYRLSGVVVAIGYLLLVPSLLGVLVSLLAFISAQTSTVRGGAAVVASGLIVFFGLCSLIGGLLGWLLVMKKTILRCTHCGAVTAAS